MGTGLSGRGPGGSGDNISQPVWAELEMSLKNRVMEQLVDPSRRISKLLHVHTITHPIYTHIYSYTQYTHTHIYTHNIHIHTIYTHTHIHIHINTIHIQRERGGE